MSETSEEKNMQMQKDFAEKIKSTIGIIQQRLQNHGGNIELADVEPDNAVKLRLRCDGDCSKAQEVLETGVKELLKQRVPEVKEVVIVN